MTGAAIAVLCVCLLGSSQPALADVTYVYVTPSGAKETNGNPVDDEVDITVSAGKVTVVIKNFQTHTAADNQNVNGVTFTLANTPSFTFSSTSASPATEVNIDSSGVGTTSTATPGWVGSATGSSVTVTTIGRSHAPETIIGPPDITSPSLKWSSANSSIAGSNHNPFILQTATFMINLTNLSASAIVTSAVFSFSTAAGDTVTGIPGGTPVIPEPSSLVLSGIGLGLGIAVAVIRRRRAIAV
jgi:hypothetical protein